MKKIFKFIKHKVANRPKKKVKKLLSIKFQEKRSDKLCIFSSFDIHSKIDPYVIFYLKELFNIGIDIVFVSTSKKVDENDLNKIKPYLRMFIHRENIGYDFGSWKMGLFAIRFKEYSQIIFANDSVYGPLFKISEIFKVMNNKKLDIWGITDSREINYHLMSYFLVYNEKVINHPIFEKNWKSVKFYPNSQKQFIINNYEIGFSELYANEGFNIGAYCNYSNLINLIRENKESLMNIDEIDLEKLNPTIKLWKQTIQYFNVPFIKRELFKEYLNISSVEIINFLELHTNFDTNLIKNHLRRINIIG